MFPNSSRYHHSPPTEPRTLTPPPQRPQQQPHTARDRSPLQDNFTSQNSPPHVRSRPNLYAGPFVDGNRNANFYNPSLASNEVFYTGGPKHHPPQNSPPYNHFARSTSHPRIQENSPSPNKFIPSPPQGLQNIRKNVVICPITHQPLIRQPPPSIFETIKEPRPITPKVTEINFHQAQRSKSPIRDDHKENSIHENPLSKSAMSPNTHQNTSPGRNYHQTERSERQSPQPKSPLPTEPSKLSNEGKFNLFEIQRQASRNKTPEMRTPSNGNPQYSHREHRVKTPAEYNFYPAPALRNNAAEYVRTEGDYKTPERKRSSQGGYGENLTSRSPVRFETPVKESEDEFCTNCVNGKMVEDRKRNAQILKEMDREKEREAARKGLNKMKRDEEWEKIKRIEKLEQGRVMQKLLEEDYEKKLEARRNKKGGIERNLFDRIFEKQDMINKHQKEIQKAGIRGLNEELQKDNRKKSPKERYMEFLDHQKATDFHRDHVNPFLPTAEEVNRVLQQQMHTKVDRKRIEHEKDVQLVNAAVNKAQRELRTETQMKNQRTHDIREQQRIQLAEIQAQKEAYRERARLEKEKERMRVDEKVSGERSKQVNEEHNRKKKNLEDLKQAIEESHKNKCIRTQREKDWEMNIRKNGNDEGILHGMGHDKQKKYKCCPGCHKQYKAQQFTKNVEINF